MPVRSNPFQKLVTLINACLKDSGTKLQESAILIDKLTGEDREVDIYLTSSIAGYEINVAIEVVDTGRKSDTTWVEKIYAKHLHLPTNKLVLVSKNGFTKPAAKKAKALEIEALSFEQALMTDWDLATRMTSTGFFQLTTINYKCEASWGPPHDPELKLPVSKATTIYLPYRDEPTDVGQMAKFFLKEPRVIGFLEDRIEKTNERSFHLVFKPQKGTHAFDENNARVELVRLIVSLDFTLSKTPIEFSTGKYGNCDVAHGKSTDPNDELYFAFIRKNGIRATGMLMDKDGIRSLTINTNSGESTETFREITSERIGGGKT